MGPIDQSLTVRLSLHNLQQLVTIHKLIHTKFDRYPEETFMPESATPETAQPQASVGFQPTSIYFENEGKDVTAASGANLRTKAIENQISTPSWAK
jgi:hypothetical protein